jgi:hypothetical protein
MDNQSRWINFLHLLKQVRLVILGLVLLASACAGAGAGPVQAVTPGPPMTMAPRVATHTPVSATQIPTPQPAQANRVKIFLIAIGDAGKSGKEIGCGDSVIPVEVEVASTTDPLAAAFEKLLSVHEQYYGQSGLYNALYQSNLKVESATIQVDLATVQISGQLLLGGECDDPRVEAQLDETALQFPEANQAAIFINGTLLKDVLSLKGEAPAATPAISVKDEPGPPYEVIFSVPVGGKGVHYEGVGVPETLPWGPAAFTVAPDGTFWIADSVKSRLLHYSREGQDLGAIGLAGLVVGIGDVAASSSEVLALDIAAQVPKILRLSQSGDVVANYELPVGLRLENGLTGIALGQTGEILVELEGGGRIFQLIDAQGEYRPAQMQGYAYGGGPTFLGANADGSFYVIGEQVISSAPIQVDQTVLYLDAAGEQVGIARAPLAEQLVYVAHGLAIGPDGAVYALVTRLESVDIVRLNFYKQLEPLQPN